MIYKILRLLMQLVLRVYFKRIYLSGRKIAEQPGPVILACNHPNSFLDAVILAVILKKPLHFLARSDVFNSSFKRWLLAQMHVIPIYRLEEGSENLSKNQDTFAHCYKILQNKGTVLIFSEGICVLEKRLRPLRKGTARLAFGAEVANDFKLNLKIVPLTLNYTYPTRFREEVIIGVADPIQVNALEQVYRQAPAKAINQLTHEIMVKLKSNLITIERPELETVTESILTISRNNYLHNQSSSWLNYSKQRLIQEIKTAESVTALYTSSPAKFAMLRQEVTYYSKNLHTAKVSDASVAGIKSTAIKKLILLIGWPLFLLGFVLNILPLWLTQLITKRKVKKREFYSSVRVALGFILSLMYYLLLFISSTILLPGKLLLLTVAVPLTGYLGLHYRDIWVERRGNSSVNAKNLTELKKLRTTILHLML